MGPLVPDIIGNELNFVVALFIGIAFGFILEQAGFSTSKKLVGLFYGYDFTVLRVFFTAGVTAMIGVIVLTHFEMLDMKLVYVNPTFLWSAIIGGLIMGLGFVIGGYCPGTSFCGAAIGKVDAIIFIIGGFIGVFLFAEFYPLFEGLYKAEYWGNIQIFELLGMSRGLFAFILTLVALAAFVFVTLIENKVNKRSESPYQPKRKYYSLIAVGVVLGFITIFLPDYHDSYKQRLNDESFISAHSPIPMDCDELAFRILDKDRSIQLFDLRDSAAYSTLRLPFAAHISIDNLFEKEVINKINIQGKRNIFYSDNEGDAVKAAALAIALGGEDVYYLKGGFNEFKNSILNFSDSEQLNRATYNFRLRASKQLPEIITASMKQPEVKKVVRKVSGGC